MAGHQISKMLRPGKIKCLMLLSKLVSLFHEKSFQNSGIRILRGPLRTADLRGPVIFYLFSEIRILRGPLMCGPYPNSCLFFIVSLIIFKTSHVQDTYKIQKHQKTFNWFLNSEDILHVFDFTKKYCFKAWFQIV